MKRAALLAAAGLAFGSGAAAQIVPLTTCHAAIPCSIPFGLRPADSLAHSPYGSAGQSNTLIAVGARVEQGLKPRVIKPPVSEDPVENAVRLYVKKNPPPARPTPSPTPGPQ